MQIVSIRSWPLAPIITRILAPIIAQLLPRTRSHPIILHAAGGVGAIRRAATRLTTMSLTMMGLTMGFMAGWTLFATILGMPGITIPQAYAAAADEPQFNGRSLSEWLTILKDDPLPRKRRAAVLALEQILTMQPDIAARVLPGLVRAAKSDSQATIRQQAVAVLGQQPAETAAAYLTDFAEALRNEKDGEVQRELATAIGRYGKLARACVLPLTDLLTTAPTATRAAAATALGKIGPEARTAGPALIALAATPDRDAHLAAAFALGRIDPTDSDLAAEAIVAILTRETQRSPRDKDTLIALLTSLGLLGEKSAEVVRAIAGQLRAPEPEVRQQAALTLGKFGGLTRMAAEPLRDAIVTDTDKLVRQYALRTLGAAYKPASGTSTNSDANANTPPDGLTAVLELLGQRLQADPDFEVRVAIAEELAAFGERAKPALPALQAARRDPQLRVREAATAAIRQIEKPATPAPGTKSGSPNK